MNLKTVGYYKEMPHGRETDPSIFDFIHKESSKKIKKICHYLEQGTTFIVTPGSVNDIIKPENGIIGVPNAYTDGEWLWPGDLAYYVRTYALKLPDDFVETMHKNMWHNTFVLNMDEYDSITIDNEVVFKRAES